DGPRGRHRHADPAARPLRDRPGRRAAVPARGGRAAGLPGRPPGRIVGGGRDRRAEHRPGHRPAAGAWPGAAAPAGEAAEPGGPVPGHGGRGTARQGVPGRQRAAAGNLPRTHHEFPLMKYLAILKDSLLESIDTKVFYVMLALGAIVVLLVASVSYRPVTV